MSVRLPPESEKLDELRLVAAAAQGDESAMETLLDRYKPLVRDRARRVQIPGADYDDVLQEGMIGLFKAVRGFAAERGIPFAAYAAVCVESQIADAARRALRRKHSPLNDSLSLQQADYAEEACSSRRLNPASDPSRRQQDREALAEIGRFIDASLTSLEKACLLGILRGQSYRAIAADLAVSIKTVDNALHRVRRKMLRSRTDRQGSPKT